MSPHNYRNFKPNLLCIAPPYGMRIPAGSAYLLGYLKANGCFDFDFLDLRLGAPFDFTPTYKSTGAFGESYVLDTPDLPLALWVIQAFEKGEALTPERTELFDRYCLERGISPSFLFSYLAAMDRYLERSFAQIDQLDFIGFSTWTPNYLFTLMAAAHLKRRRSPPVIVAGGPQVTASKAAAELGLRSGLFDVVALSEGEQTLVELFDTFKRTGGVTGVDGTLVFDQSSNKIIRRERDTLKLDTLAMPSFDEMPLAAYQERAISRSLPFQLSRGCTDKCSFCSEWVFWKRYRSDTPEHALGQIKTLLNRYNAGFIEFSDSLLNGHQKRLIAFAEGVIKEGLEFGWTSFMRAQMDPETAELIARSGCTGVFVGIESFSDEALELMNKRRTSAQNIEAIRAFVEAGIHVTAGFIPGFPGDSRPGFLQSARVVAELQQQYPGRIELHEEPFTVMANAPILKQLDVMGLVPRLWAEEYLDISPQYRDATEDVVCSVEGSEQGLERIGRTKLVGAIKSDSPVRGVFEEGIDEAIAIDQFSVIPIFGGWYSAYKKSRAGHRYSLIVNDDESNDLMDQQAEWFPVDETQPAVAAYLAELEAKHIAPPCRSEQRIVRALFRCTDYEQAIFTLSPFVVARDLGWRHHGQILVLNTVTDVSSRRPPREAHLFRALVAKAARGDELWATAEIRQSFKTRKQLLSTLENLNEIGIIVRCDGKEALETSIWESPVTVAVAALPVQPRPAGDGLVQLQRQ